MGVKLFSDSAFDTRLCAAACTYVLIHPIAVKTFADLGNVVLKASTIVRIHHEMAQPEYADFTTRTNCTRTICTRVNIGM